MDKILTDSHDWGIPESLNLSYGTKNASKADRGYEEQKLDENGRSTDPSVQ